MERPTTLKLHEFADDSFVHGCYIPTKICDDLIDYFNDTPDRHESGQVYGTCEKHINELIEELQKIEDKTLSVRCYCPELEKCIDELNEFVPAKEQIQSDINQWLDDIDVSDTGDTGYENNGEVRLIGRE